MLNGEFSKEKDPSFLVLFKGAASTGEIHCLPRCYTGVARSTLENLPLATSFGTMELQEMSRRETG